MRNDPALEPADAPLSPAELGRVLIEGCPDVLWVENPDFKLVFVSAAIEVQTGWRPDEYLALRPEERIVEEDLARIARLHGEFREERDSPGGLVPGRIRTVEVRRRCKDGRLCWAEIKAAAFWDVRGGLRGIQGVTRNIEEWKDQERDQQDGVERHRKLLEMLPIGVFECDLGGRINYLNDAMYRMFRYPEEARSFGFSIPQVVIPEDWERVKFDMTRRLSDAHLPPGIYTGLRKDGTKLPIEVHSSVIEKEGRPIGFRGVIIDASDKKRYEAEILKSNKLEALGLLAGGIAHDFNNMLAAVMGNINLAGLEMADLSSRGQALAEVESAERLLHEAESAILRARDLTSRLLTFSRGGTPIKEAFSLEALVSELGNFNTSGSACRFEFRAEADLPALMADRSQLAQLIQNLIINAIQAMPGGGAVRVGLGREGDRLRLDVDDEGPGVPEDLRTSIFDPYFTTKSSGSGLGLAVCLAVARAHGGDIAVADSPEGGARFTVYLPMDAAGECPETPGKSLDPKPTPGLGILFVDDEESIRKVVEEMGSRLGYRIVTAADGDEALAAWGQGEDPERGFDLAIVDLTIRGGPGGLQILEKLKKLAPAMPVLVSSGYSDDPSLADWRKAGFAGLLRKPYDMSAFALAVETAHRSSCQEA